MVFPPICAEESRSPPSDVIEPDLDPCLPPYRPLELVVWGKLSWGEGYELEEELARGDLVLSIDRLEAGNDILRE